MLASIANELRRRVEAHRLAVEERRRERRGMPALEPRRDVDEERKARRVALGEAVAAEAPDALEDLLGEGGRVATGRHALDEPAAELVDRVAGTLPRGQGASQLIGLARREAGRDDREGHRLLLKKRHAEGALEHATHRVVGELDRLVAATSPQVGMDHVALNGARPHDRDFDDEVVEASRPQPRQHVHLRAALDLEDPDRVAAAEHVVDRWILRGNGVVFEADGHRGTWAVGGMGRWVMGLMGHHGPNEPHGL